MNNHLNLTTIINHKEKFNEEYSKSINIFRTLYRFGFSKSEITDLVNLLCFDFNQLQQNKTLIKVFETKSSPDELDIILSTDAKKLMLSKYNFIEYAQTMSDLFKTLQNSPTLNYEHISAEFKKEFGSLSNFLYRSVISVYDPIFYMEYVDRKIIKRLKKEKKEVLHNKEKDYLRLFI